METAAEKDVEVALSGGGFRAAAFALGVLLYVVHSGLNRRVATIASVSGGSITNGFVASRDDFGSMDVDRFRATAAELAQRLSGKGKLRGFPLVIWPYMVALLISGVMLAWWLRTIIQGVVVWQWGITVHATRWELIAFYMSASLWGVATLLRDEVVRGWLAWTFLRPTRASLALTPARSVDHVFCTTDLTSSGPLFFSTHGGGRIFSEHYGRGDGSDVSLSIAVARSAAFPPAISPGSLEILKRKFTARPPGLTTVWLTDGGVWNNLGTDWTHLTDSIREAETAWLKKERGSEQTVAESQAKVNCPSSAILLIANASMPDEPKNLLHFKVPGLAVLMTTARIISVSVNSTILARTSEVERIVRLERARGQKEPVLVPMTRTPDAGLRAGEPDFEAIRALEPLWKEERIIRTTFNNIGRENTLRMIVRGYLNARHAMVGKAGHTAPKIPERKWFDDLVPTS